MKILDLKIEGFRSLKSVEWKPGDINILIGPNAGGKSNLLQALEIIAESAKGKLNDFVIKQQGGMGSLVWDGKAESIKLEIEFYESRHTQNPNEIMEYILDLARLGKSSSYLIYKEVLKIKDFHDCLIKRTSSSAKILDNNKKHDINREVINESESVLSDSYSILGGKTYIAQMRKKFVSWNIYCHFDTGPKTDVRKDFIVNPEKSVTKDGQNFPAVLHTLHENDSEFKSEIDNAMRAAFGEDFERMLFPSTSNQRIQLAVKWKSLKDPQYTSVLSDGTLRFLYLLTILADPEPPALIAIDEPEVGLHPRMLPIVAEYALEASRRTQVILATHSPDMLSAFGKRQSEVTVTVAGWEEGQTILKTLGGEKLEYWLKEYTLGELFRSGELEDM